MSYVERVLQPGEQVRHISSIHWILYWPGVAVALLAVAAYWFGETRWLPRAWQYTAYALALVAVVLLVKEWLQWWITEIAVTNRRVIYKRGLIRLQTNEMNMDKVESVQVNQSILGRMFDFGTVRILGTGEGFEALQTIAGPIKLRNSTSPAREVYKRLLTSANEIPSIADGLLRHRQQRRRHGEIGCLAADHSIFRPPFLPINTLPRNVRILHRPRIVRPWRSPNDAEHPSRACIDGRVSLIASGLTRRYHRLQSQMSHFH